jgi:hypothetical protein
MYRPREQNSGLLYIRIRSLDVMCSCTYCTYTVVSGKIFFRVPLCFRFVGVVCEKIGWEVPYDRVFELRIPRRQDTHKMLKAQQKHLDLVHTRTRRNNWLD